MTQYNLKFLISNFQRESLKIKNYSGQVAIVVLLVSAVMLTLGLSMSQKEVVQIKINNNDELLKKAFDSAESGINYYLGTGGTSYVSPDKISFSKITATEIGIGSTINFGEFTPMGSSENFWLVDHLASGDIGTSYYSGLSMDICSESYTGLVKADYFYKVLTVMSVKRNILNIASNCKTVNFAAGQSPVLISVTPINSGGKFYVQALAGFNFKSQGTDIVSDGTAGGAQTGVWAQASKKITVRKRYKLPGFLLSGMMAEGSILSD